jgi:N-acetylglutamate synthase-like GNAT family acetyltransferase
MYKLLLINLGVIKMRIIRTNLNLCEDAIFNLSIRKGTELVGNLTVYKHPQDVVGGQVHIEIVPKWRNRWVSRSLRNNLMDKLISVAKGFGLKVLYSTAFTDVSPRLLEFAGFTEYNAREPKTYYYLMIDGA